MIGRSAINVALANPFVQHSLVVVQRNDSSFVPHNNTIYAKDDVCYFICKTEDVDSVQKMTGKPNFKVKNIMILGCGKIGRLLSKSLQYDYNVKIIEKNIDKANKYEPSIKKHALIDSTIDINQSTAEESCAELAKKNGIFCGISAAANIFISKKIARENRNSVVVTIICDRGDRYLSKI